MKTNLNIYFNKTCKKLNLISKYVNVYIKRNSHAAVKIKLAAKNLCLNFEIKYLYSKKYELVTKKNHINFEQSKFYTLSQVNKLNKKIQLNFKIEKMRNGLESIKKLIN